MYRLFCAITVSNIWFKTHSMRWSLCSTILKWLSARDYIDQVSKNKQNKHYSSAKETKKWNDIWWHFPIFIDQWINQQSSENILLQVNGNKYRNPICQAICTEWKTMKWSVLKRMFPSITLPREQENHRRRKRQKECKRHRGWRTPINQGLLDTTMLLYISTHRVWNGMHRTYTSFTKVRWNAERRSGYTPIPKPEAISNWKPLVMEN